VYYEVAQWVAQCAGVRYYVAQWVARVYRGAS
jgi:hypothetical protein